MNVLQFCNNKYVTKFILIALILVIEVLLLVTVGYNCIKYIKIKNNPVFSTGKIIKYERQTSGGRFGQSETFVYTISYTEENISYKSKVYYSNSDFFYVYINVGEIPIVYCKNVPTYVIVDDGNIRLIPAIIEFVFLQTAYLMIIIIGINSKKILKTLNRKQQNL